MKYGDKRDYRKIDIIVDGKYVASTTWAKSCKEAKEQFLKTTGKTTNPKSVKTRFA